MLHWNTCDDAKHSKIAHITLNVVTLLRKNYFGSAVVHILVKSTIFFLAQLAEFIL